MIQGLWEVSQGLCPSSRAKKGREHMPIWQFSMPTVMSLYQWFSIVPGNTRHVCLRPADKNVVGCQMMRVWFFSRKMIMTQKLSLSGFYLCLWRNCYLDQTFFWVPTWLFILVTKICHFLLYLAKIKLLISNIRVQPV